MTYITIYYLVVCWHCSVINYSLYISHFIFASTVIAVCKVAVSRSDNAMQSDSGA